MNELHSSEMHYRMEIVCLTRCETPSNRNRSFKGEVIEAALFFFNAAMVRFLFNIGCETKRAKEVFTRRSFERTGHGHPISRVLPGYGR